MNNIQAVIITIGDELLIGQTIDTNSAWIAQRLNHLGINVLRRVAVGDTREAILNALDEEWLKASLIILTGGLGPTSDDITKPLLCEYFGGTLTVNEEVAAHLKEIFGRRNRPILARNMKQAEVPDNCTVLFNKLGTAPGMWFEKNGKIIISLPGVPFEMKHIMEVEALPRLKQLAEGDVIIHRTVFTAGEGESFIAERLMPFEAALPEHIKIAYLPDSGFVKIRLTGKGAEVAVLEAEMMNLQNQLVTTLGDIVIANEDVTLESLLGTTMQGNGKTFGFAESCTGGYIGHLITQLPGSSTYFKGSIVSYDNEVKENVLGVKKETIEQKGAVSEETVIEMATGALKILNTDYTLAVSGVLGPDGGTERVKTGTVWMAVANKDRVLTKVQHFFYDRERNKEMAAKMGMLLLWKFINGKQ
ncbi:MAG: CinA family nicotinamide mononucleotide deamidase-related protein [Taibaiella sp.]|nr:CinA family nicotinamide mononucleotide deamidase-related protein [Taibaiella sp.]